MSKDFKKSGSIAAKLFLITFVGIVLTATAVLTTVLINKREAIVLLTHQDLSSSMAALDMVLDNMKQTSMGGSQVLAQNNEFAQAVASGNSSTIESRIAVMMQDIFTFSNPDIVLVADANGYVLYRTHDSRRGDSIMYRPSISRALSTGEITSEMQYETEPELQVGVVSTVPIRLNGQVVGVVAVGYNLAVESFVDEVSRITGTMVTVFSNVTSVMSTNRLPDGNRSTGTTMAQHFQDTVTLGLPYEGPGTVLGMEFLVYYRPIMDDNNEYIGAVFVGQNLTEIRSMERRTILIAILTTVVAIAIVLTISTILNNMMIAKPLVKLTALVSDVTHGRLSFNRDKGALANDEIGQLTHDMYELNDVIKGIVDDLSRVNYEYKGQGDIDYRVDASKYQNSFKDMVEGINHILENDVEAIMQIIDTLNQINNGDFNIRINDMPGKMIILPQTLRAVVTNLKEIYESAAFLAAKAAKGEFDTEIEHSKFKGNWADLIHTLNQLMGAIAEPLEKIKEDVILMSEGNFVQLHDDFKGQFNVLKNACNLTNETSAAYVNEIAYVLGCMAQGDLTVSIQKDYIGSYAPIKKALNTILDSLNRSISGIHAATDHVSAGAELLSRNSVPLAEGAARQGDAVNELLASVELISRNINLSSENARLAHESATNSMASVEKGEEVVRRMLDSMDKLKESSNDISKIIKVISDIAFQTNLLALNAAVEAARAGEHGRGFSVVAEEVRNLAGKSQESTDSTSAIIERDRRYAEDGVTAATEVAQTFTTIIGDISRRSGIIEQIAGASTEQVNTIANINNSVAEISGVIHENSATAEEFATASQELNSQTDALKELVSFFKLR